MNFGIIGLGSIAAKFAKGIHKAHGAKLYAVAARSKEKSEIFAQKYRAETAYGSYDELLNDKKVEVVYIALPHPFHYEWAMKAIEHKKHIICEKPCGMTEKEVIEMTEAAKKANVYFAEGFMYRFHPQTTQVIDIIKNGVIGEIKHIKASFGYNFMGMECPPERIYKKELGGGGILDVGCYPLSYVRMLVSAINDKLSEPIKFNSVGIKDSNGVDLHSDAILEFECGITATIGTSIDSMQSNDCIIFGSKGYLTIKDPFTCSINKTTPAMTAHFDNGKTKRYYIDAKYLYSYEIESLMEYANTGESPYISHLDSIGNAKFLELWLSQF